MDSHLTPAKRPRIQIDSPDGRVNNSITSGISYNQSHNHSRSIQDLSHSYRDTTFGTTKRMHIPKSNKIGFLPPTSTNDKKLGVIPKSERKIQLNYHGIDSPSPTKYDSLRSMELLKPNRGRAFSFRKASYNLSLVDAEVNISTGISSITPGPGAYYPKLKEVGKDGPQFTISKHKSGYSYLPNVMEFPSATKYDPKPAYLRQNFAKEGLGILRARRDYSYINDQKTPGPANYETLKDLRVPNTLLYGKIDRSPRNLSIGSKKITPGPGDYDLLKPLQQNHDWESARNRANQYRELRRVLSVPRAQHNSIHNK